MAAGTALIGAMATDAWQQAREAVVSLWQRVHPERADTVRAELGEVRTELLAARAAGDEEAEEGLAVDWRRRLQRLLASDPSLTAELRRIIDEELSPLLPPAPAAAAGPVITMRANASGNSTVIQAGHDAHVTGHGTAR
ncbi:hypothetical protein ACFVZ3_02785 [Kitasatospora purpeofusca]|uniref:hypothetical protein n=1 Tax=Kitasatospora purpeofusca TaxID=67352 RepID=UPI00365F7090